MKPISVRVAEIRLDQSDKGLSPFIRCQTKIARVRRMREEGEIRRPAASTLEASAASEQLFSYDFDRSTQFSQEYVDETYGVYKDSETVGDPDPRSF